MSIPLSTAVGRRFARRCFTKCKILSSNTPLTDELSIIRLTAFLRYVVLIDYRLQYSRRMGTIRPGEAYDHYVPNAKRISDPSRRCDSMNVTKVF